MPVLKTSRRWGQVGEHHGVIYDTKSRVVSLYYYYLFAFLCLKTILVNAKESDLNSQSEIVWFSCLKSSYCIQRVKSGWGGGMCFEIRSQA